MTTPLTPWDQVQRFTFGAVAGQKANDGQWVDYDDYAALRQQVEELEHENKNLLTCQCENCDESLEENAVCGKCFAAATKENGTLKDACRQHLAMLENAVTQLVQLKFDE